MSSITAIPNEVAIRDHRRPRPRFRFRRTVWSTAIALVLFVLGLLIAKSLEGRGVEALAEPPMATDSPPELPREWQWHREPITFDHMYRKKPTRHDPWIRNGGRRD